jgi:hypothetical protein
MSMKSKFSAAALVTVIAMSALATTDANAFSPGPVGPKFLVSPASAASMLCDGAVSRRACGAHMAYLGTLQARRGEDTSPNYIKNFDPRDNQAMRDAGGGGGGGGGGGAVVDR